jgi:hypothetical protein
MESRGESLNARSEEYSPIQMMCVYTQEDEPFYHKLKISLHLWQREGAICWLETEAGRDREQTMHTHLQQADLILLLISPDFLASDLCYMVMKSALHEQTRRQVPIVPILTRASAWKRSACGGMFALPDNEQPIAEWRHAEQAYENIRLGLAHSHYSRTF